MEVGNLEVLLHWELSQNKVIQSKIDKTKGIVIYLRCLLFCYAIEYSIIDKRLSFKYNITNF